MQGPETYQQTRGYRRSVFASFCALITLFSAYSANAACSLDDGKTFINTLGTEAISLATAAKNLDSDAREQELRRLLRRGFDLPTISRFVLGRYWRTADADERKDYQSTFEDYLVKSYAARLLSYRSETFVITEAKPGKKTGAADISTQIYRPESKPISVLWRLNCRNERQAIFDVVIEGVSMALTQRSEIASVVQKNGNGVAGLIEELKSKITAFN